MWKCDAERADSRTYGVRILQGRLDLGVAQEHVAAADAPQHPLKRGNSFAKNNTSDETGEEKIKFSKRVMKGGPRKKGGGKGIDEDEKGVFPEEEKRPPTNHAVQMAAFLSQNAVSMWQILNLEFPCGEDFLYQREKPTLNCWPLRRKRHQRRSWTESYPSAGSNGHWSLRFLAKLGWKWISYLHK